MKCDTSIREEKIHAGEKNCREYLQLNLRYVEIETLSLLHKKKSHNWSFLMAACTHAIYLYCIIELYT